MPSWVCQLLDLAEKAFGPLAGPVTETDFDVPAVC